MFRAECENLLHEPYMVGLMPEIAANQAARTATAAGSMKVVSDLKYTSSTSVVENNPIVATISKPETYSFTAVSVGVPPEGCLGVSSAGCSVFDIGDGVQ